MPYPNFKVLQPNIKTFRVNKAIGIMEQAAYQGRGGEFAELRAYVIARLLWNPDCNVDDVINDFMFGYYGRSGKFIREYFDLLHQRITPDTHIHLNLPPEDEIFTGDFIRKAGDLFTEAEKVADHAGILHRVEMAFLPVLYLKCKRIPAAALLDGSYDKFCRITQREGITFYNERGEFYRKKFHAEMENP